MTETSNVLTRGAYRGALLAALLNGFGSPIELAISAAVPGVPIWPPLASSAVGLAVAAILLARRSVVTIRSAAGAFLVNNAAIIGTLWITNQHFAEVGPRWTPFQANKLGALAAALLAPELWSGLIVIIGFSGSAIGQFLLLSKDVQHQIQVGEPWTTLVYGMFGIALLVHQLRRRAFERAAVEAQIKAAAMEELAAKVMAIRDLANTPLQTIEFSSALLRRRDPALGPELDRLDRALARLHDLDIILEDLDVRTHGESFDALQLLTSRRSS